MGHHGENVISFQISGAGKVLPYPKGSIQSTSHEMQQKFERIIPKASEYIEFLLWKEFQKTE